MPEANSAPILLKSVSQHPRVKPGPPTKPKLLYRLRDALRPCRSFATRLLEADMIFGPSMSFCSIAT
jgi:hypothetical protein